MHSVAMHDANQSGDVFMVSVAVENRWLHKRMQAYSRK